MKDAPQHILECIFDKFDVSDLDIFFYLSKRINTILKQYLKEKNLILLRIHVKYPDFILGALDFGFTKPKDFVTSIYRYSRYPESYYCNFEIFVRKDTFIQYYFENNEKRITPVIKMFVRPHHTNKNFMEIFDVITETRIIKESYSQEYLHLVDHFEQYVPEFDHRPVEHIPLLL